MFKSLKLVRKQSSTAKVDVSDLLKVNMVYIWIFMLGWGFPTFYCALAIAGHGNTTNIFKAKYGWDEDETKLMNTIISTAGIIGIAIGSFTGGKLL